MNKIWKPSPNYSANMGAKTVIVCHWWGNPADKPSLLGTVNWLCNPSSRVSAHYVVSGRTVYQLVDENNVAWHAMQANPFSIGIEIDPNTPPGTYETVIELAREIAARHLMNRSTCIKAHRDYVNTQCPGTIDVGRIRAGVASQEGPSDVTIFIRPIGHLQATFKQPIMMYNIETNQPMWESGLKADFVAKTNIVHGSTFYITADRWNSGEPFGFKEEHIYASGNKVVDVTVQPGVDPLLKQKADKYDQIKHITG